ncbi:hypothetical protein ACRAWD_20320 [Caulobacter segnis]
MLKTLLLIVGGLWLSWSYWPAWSAGCCCAASTSPTSNWRPRPPRPALRRPAGRRAPALQGRGQDRRPAGPGPRLWRQPLLVEEGRAAGRPLPHHHRRPAGPRPDPRAVDWLCRLGRRAQADLIDALAADQRLPKFAIAGNSMGGGVVPGRWRCTSSRARRRSDPGRRRRLAGHDAEEAAPGLQAAQVLMGPRFPALDRQQTADPLGPARRGRRPGRDHRRLPHRPLGRAATRARPPGHPDVDPARQAQPGDQGSPGHPSRPRPWCCGARSHPLIEVAGAHKFARKAIPGRQADRLSQGRPPAPGRDPTSAHERCGGLPGSRRRPLQDRSRCRTRLSRQTPGAAGPPTPPWRRSTTSSTASSAT